MTLPKSIAESWPLVGGGLTELQLQPVHQLEYIALC
jgi:hypothetical protein